MTDLDKFASDADRVLSRALKPGATARAAATELSRLLASSVRGLEPLAEGFALIWERRFADSLTPGNARAAVDWLVAAFAFLSDAFAPEMDFPDDDWEDIRELLSAEAEDLDMDTLTSMMTVIVERGKA